MTDQSKFIKSNISQNLLNRHGMEDCNSVTTPLDTTVKVMTTMAIEALANQSKYQSIVGGLIVMRSDIMCAVGKLPSLTVILPRNI
jgi:hypothetical protein